MKQLLQLAIPTIMALLVGSVHAGEINVAINQSPWLDGFRKTTQEYEKETGNKVTLSVSPYDGLLEKIRNSLRSPKGQFDLVILDAHWLAEVYAGGFLTPINKIDPGFKLDPAVLDFDQTLYWDNAHALFQRASGELMGLPITGNVELMYYRKDLYAANGLKVPTTWEELRKNTEKLKGKVEYPLVIWGQRDGALARAMPFMMSAGGGIFKDPRNGNYGVIFNTKESLEGLKAYIEFAKSSFPNPGSLTLSDISQLISTGKAAQTIEVAALWGAVNNPDSSIVAGKMGVAPVPGKVAGKPLNSSGHWVGGVPKNVDQKEQKEALNFMIWLLRKNNQVALFENGSIPVRSDLVGAANDPGGVLPALSESIKYSSLITPVKESAQIYSLLGAYINQALIGETTPEKALNAGAKDVYELMKRAGYKTSIGPDL
jgi:multiple sugar transport system substrate-binding protein